MTKTLTTSQPIVLGLTGTAGTGKTSTADGLAPMGGIDTGSGSRIHWNHLFFALPLYSMARTRLDIEGDQAKDRMRYEIHSTLLEVFGASPIYGAPPYKQLVSMVEEIVNRPIDRNGKPRSFLQYVGTELCRAYEPDCWINWMKNKIRADYHHFVQEYTDTLVRAGKDESEVEPQAWGTVISDCRFPNEAKWVADNPNGVLIKLVADPKVLKERLMARDGKVLTKEQASHPSEKEVDKIDKRLFDEIVDTSDMDIPQQVEHIRKLVESMIGD